jgi:hypothetical protein
LRFRVESGNTSKGVCASTSVLGVTEIICSSQCMRFQRWWVGG